MSDFEHQLEDELKAAAAGVQPRHTDVGHILSGGAQRVKRRQVRLAIGGFAMAGVAVIGGVVVLTRDTGTDVSVASEADSTGPDASATDRAPETSVRPAPAGDGLAVVVPSDLTWRSVDVDSAEALGVYSTWGTGVQGDSLFEVSTEPGRTSRAQPTLWRSDDGVSWQPRSSLPLMPRSVTAVDGSIYAVGTAPSEGRVAKSAGGNPVVARSSDGGDKWDTIDVPIDLLAIEDAPGVSSVMVNTWVADGPAGAIVLVQPWAQPDLGSIPDYDPDYGYVLYDDGVGVYGPVAGQSTMPCEMPTTSVGATADTTDASTDTTASTIPGVDTTAVVECGVSTAETSRLTWAELGADTETVPYLQARRFFAYTVTADGTVSTAGSFTLDGAAGQFSANSFTGTDAGYVLMGNTYATDGTTSSWSMTSPDGATWSTNQILANGYLSGPASWPGGLAGLVQSFDDQGNAIDTRAALSPDGASWSQVDLDPVLDQISLDGNRWVGGLTGGHSGISVLVGFQTPDTSAPSGTVPPDTAPTGTAPIDGSTETTAIFVQSTTSFAVLHSTDGVRWSFDLPDELQDIQSPVNIRQAGSRVVVVIQQPADGNGGLPGQLALVATPNG